MSAWRLRPGVVLTEIKGVYLLVADKEARMNCPYVREINEIGAFIWKKLEEKADRGEIVSALRREYDIPEEYSPKEDVDAFVHLLQEDHYILSEAEEHEI